MEASLGAGPWAVHAGVNPKNLDRAVEGIVGEIKRLRSEPVTQDELSEAKDFVTGSLALRWKQTTASRGRWPTLNYSAWVWTICSVIRRSSTRFRPSKSWRRRKSTLRLTIMRCRSPDRWMASSKQYLVSEQ